MRVGWLCDDSPVLGGAELTQAEFRAAAPPDVEVVDCPPEAIDATCDRFVLHNILTYQHSRLRALIGKPAVKYHHDVGPWVHRDVKTWLNRHTTQVYCSPIQATCMGAIEDRVCIPPPVDLARFREASASVNGDRSGAVSVASWANPGKAPHRVAEWSVANEESIDFFGGGVCAPPGSVEVAYDAMPALLARYQRFVFLPVVLEPFGRLVVEAHAAGCEVVTNGLVGARWWLENDPDALERAAEDFWRTVLA